MRALVTGASGFIAGRVIARLEFEGWSVGRVVRGATADAGLNLGVGEAADFDRMLEAFTPDVVYHLAGRTSGSANELYAANVVLATNLLQAVSRQTSPCAVVLAGSAAEYGFVEADALPVTEDHPCRPLTDYGVSKHAQTLAGLARARAGLPVMVARIFNPLGPGMPRNLALPNFAAQIAVSDVLRVGDLDVERDFIDVDDAARAIVALAPIAANYGKVFNICSGRGFVLRQLVEDMIRLSGRRVRLEVESARLRPNDMRRLVGSTGRLGEAGMEVRAPDMELLLRALLADAAPEEASR